MLNFELRYWRIVPVKAIGSISTQDLHARDILETHGTMSSTTGTMSGVSIKALGGWIAIAIDFDFQ